MIRFSCKCGFEFNLVDGRAGEMVQCPRCALLVDAPRADELSSLGADGTYRVGETEAEVPGRTLAEMYRVYSKPTTDAFGNQRDLRPDAEHFRRIGVEPGATFSRPQRIVPRYDPVTGERIVPLGLKEEAPQPVLPLDEEMALAVEAEAIPVVEPDEYASAIPVHEAPSGPVRPLRYATADTGHPVTVRSLAVDLLIRPANLTVLFFIWWFYVAAVLLKIPLNAFALFEHFPPALANLLNFPLWLLAAHYGCVVQETGPDLMDDVPRPLRNLDLGEDLFGPAIRVAAAAVICYGPMFAVGAATGMASGPAAAATLLLAATGSLLFPAVVLTLLTGTTVLNLTPLRVLGVIVDCGPQYVVSAALAALTLALSAWVVLGPVVLPPLDRFPGAHAADSLFVLVPGLALTAYVTHAFAFHLGFLYRAHHHSFPWLAQRHIPRPRPPRVRMQV